MTLSQTVQLLQAFAGALWLMPLCLNAKAVWRLLRGRADIMDVLRAPYFFAALVMVLGTARWLIFSSTLALMGQNELYFWTGIYLLSLVSAAAVTWSLLYSERFR